MWCKWPVTPQSRGSHKEIGDVFVPWQWIQGNGHDCAAGQRLMEQNSLTLLWALTELSLTLQCTMPNVGSRVAS